MTKRETTRRINPLIDPLYYDLLSGEFSPISDPSGSQHSMGRLAIATYRKGLETGRDNKYAHREYTPSWAPHISTRIMLDLRDEYEEIGGVSLAVIDNEKRGYNLIDFDLDLLDIEAGIVPQLVIRHTDRDVDKEERYPLELGPNLNDVKDRVAQYANHIFLRAHVAL